MTERLLMRQVREILRLKYEQHDFVSGRLSLRTRTHAHLDDF
jgi:hypothetical protein